MDFTVDEKILNFIEPPPEKLAAMEQARPDRFSITQLRTVVGELEELAKEFGDDQGGIPNKQVCELFLRKLENSKSLWDEGSLPEEWWTLREYDFQNVARNLDRAGQGALDWRQLATFLILLKSPLPSDQEIESLRTAFGAAGLLDRQAFQQAKAWFDKSEYSQDREYSVAFPRVRMIKDLLFDVHREHALAADAQNERISAETLAQALLSAREVVQGNIVKKSDRELL